MPSKTSTTEAEAKAIAEKRSTAAKKAWVTIRANRAKAEKEAKPKKKAPASKATG